MDLSYFKKNIHEYQQWKKKIQQTEQATHTFIKSQSRKPALPAVRARSTSPDAARSSQPLRSASPSPSPSPPRGAQQQQPQPRTRSALAHVSSNASSTINNMATPTFRSKHPGNTHRVMAFAAHVEAHLQSEVRRADHQRRAHTADSTSSPRAASNTAQHIIQRPASTAPTLNVNIHNMSPSLLPAVSSGVVHSSPSFSSSRVLVSPSGSGAEGHGQSSLAAHLAARPFINHQLQWQHDEKEKEKEKEKEMSARDKVPHSPLRPFVPSFRTSSFIKAKHHSSKEQPSLFFAQFQHNSSTLPLSSPAPPSSNCVDVVDVVVPPSTLIVARAEPPAAVEAPTHSTQPTAALSQQHSHQTHISPTQSIDDHSTVSPFNTFSTSSSSDHVTSRVAQGPFNAPSAHHMVTRDQAALSSHHSLTSPSHAPHSHMQPMQHDVVTRNFETTKSLKKAKRSSASTSSSNSKTDNAVNQRSAVVSISSLTVDCASEAPTTDTITISLFPVSSSSSSSSSSLSPLVCEHPSSTPTPNHDASATSSLAQVQHQISALDEDQLHNTHVSAQHSFNHHDSLIDNTSDNEHLSSPAVASDEQSLEQQEALFAALSPPPSPLHSEPTSPASSSTAEAHSHTSSHHPSYQSQEPSYIHDHVSECSDDDNLPNSVPDSSTTSSHVSMPASPVLSASSPPPSLPSRPSSRAHASSRPSSRAQHVSRPSSSHSFVLQPINPAELGAIATHLAAHSPPTTPRSQQRSTARAQHKPKAELRSRTKHSSPEAADSPVHHKAKASRSKARSHVDSNHKSKTTQSITDTHSHESVITECDNNTSSAIVSESQADLLPDHMLSTTQHSPGTSSPVSPRASSLSPRHTKQFTQHSTSPHLSPKSTVRRASSDSQHPSSITSHVSDQSHAVGQLPPSTSTLSGVDEVEASVAHSNEETNPAQPISTLNQPAQHFRSSQDDAPVPKKHKVKLKKHHSQAPPSPAAASTVSSPRSPRAAASPRRARAKRRSADNAHSPLARRPSVPPLVMSNVSSGRTSPNLYSTEWVKADHPAAFPGLYPDMFPSNWEERKEKERQEKEKQDNKSQAIELSTQKERAKIVDLSNPQLPNVLITTVRSTSLHTPDRSPGRSPSRSPVVSRPASAMGSIPLPVTPNAANSNNSSLQARFKRTLAIDPKSQFDYPPIITSAHIRAEELEVKAQQSKPKRYTVKNLFLPSDHPEMYKPSPFQQALLTPSTPLMVSSLLTPYSDSVPSSGNTPLVRESSRDKYGKDGKDITNSARPATSQSMFQDIVVEMKPLDPAENRRKFITIQEHNASSPTDSPGPNSRAPSPPADSARPASVRAHSYLPPPGYADLLRSMSANSSDANKDVMQAAMKGWGYGYVEKDRRWVQRVKNEIIPEVKNPYSNPDAERKPTVSEILSSAKLSDDKISYKKRGGIYGYDDENTGDDSNERSRSQLGAGGSRSRSQLRDSDSPSSSARPHSADGAVRRMRVFQSRSVEYDPFPTVRFLFLPQCALDAQQCQDPNCIHYELKKLQQDKINKEEREKIEKLKLEHEEKEASDIRYRQELEAAERSERNQLSSLSSPVSIMSAASPQTLLKPHVTSVAAPPPTASSPMASSTPSSPTLPATSQHSTIVPLESILSQNPQLLSPRSPALPLSLLLSDAHVSPIHLKGKKLTHTDDASNKHTLNGGDKQVKEEQRVKEAFKEKLITPQTLQLHL